MILLNAKGQKGLKEGRAEKEVPLIPENFRDGIPVEQIAKSMHMPPEAVQKIIDDSQAPDKNCVSLKNEIHSFLYR